MVTFGLVCKTMLHEKYKDLSVQIAKMSGLPWRHSASGYSWKEEDLLLDQPLCST